MRRASRTPQNQPLLTPGRCMDGGRDRSEDKFMADLEQFSVEEGGVGAWYGGHGKSERVITRPIYQHSTPITRSLSPENYPLKCPHLVMLPLLAPPSNQDPLGSKLEAIQYLSIKSLILQKFLLKTCPRWISRLILRFQKKLLSSSPEQKKVSSQISIGWKVHPHEDDFSQWPRCHRHHDLVWSQGEQEEKRMVRCHLPTDNLDHFVFRDQHSQSQPDFYIPSNTTAAVSYIPTRTLQAQSDFLQLLQRHLYEENTLLDQMRTLVRQLLLHWVLRSHSRTTVENLEMSPMGAPWEDFFHRPIPLVLPF